MPSVHRIPGLHDRPTKADLDESRRIYNQLPTDDCQPDIAQHLRQALPSLFVNHGAHVIFRIHSLHRHHQLLDGTVPVGADVTGRHGRWTRPLPADLVDAADAAIRGHVFRATVDGFHPYEYHEGDLPDLTKVDPAFFREFHQYVLGHGLQNLIALELLQPAPNLMELLLGNQTITLEASDLKGCVPSSPTSWTFTSDSGGPRVCAESGQTYHVVEEGKHRVFKDEIGMKSAGDAIAWLQQAGVLAD